MKIYKPTFAITMGDPAGIGPEIIIKTLIHPDIYNLQNLVVIGNYQKLQWAAEILKIQCQIRQIIAVSEAEFITGVINVMDTGPSDLSHIKPGKISAEAGAAAYEYIRSAIQYSMDGLFDGVVTAPISKEALNLAGFHYDGHTEIFAEKTNTPKVTMMLASKNFRVTHVSTHCSLREAINRCKTERILDVTRITNCALLQMGIKKPHIAIAGLNPHCGEGGLFGMEDIEEIQPAIDQANSEGIHVYPQPVPPDTVFFRMAYENEFDAVVAQYHDMGHIAAKMADFFGGVNITLGLPIIRTSVDHGTAFGITGKGIANESSLIQAIEYATILATNK